jgi:ATP-binding cassette subfamily C (CFTR/MRP) protein 1
MFAVRCQLKNAGKALAFIENALIPFSVLQMCGIAIIAKYIGNAQKVWIEGIQTRVDVTASMLSSMKVQKLLSEPAPG